MLRCVATVLFLPARETFTLQWDYIVATMWVLYLVVRVYIPMEMLVEMRKLSSCKSTCVQWTKFLPCVQWSEFTTHLTRC